MDEKQRARRRFLERLGGVGLVAGAGVVLGGRALAQGTTPAVQNCDASGLSEQQIQTRNALQYTDNSSKADQFCHNCQYFKPASGEGCGTCSIVPGPINPQGWCTAWVKKS